MKLISVIVPVYNMEKYLPKCIESIIYQTYSRMEIILIDDGSTDTSGEICNQYREQDGRIKVVHKENGGLSSARNTGIDIASGELITFVDADDWIDPNMYLYLYNSIEKYDADIAICQANFVKCDGFVSVHNTYYEVVYSGYEATGALIEDRLIKSYVWNKMYKSELFNTVRFPPGKTFEDVYIMHILFLKANRVVHIGSPLYYYLQRNDSIVHTASLDNLANHFDSYLQRYLYIQKYIPKYGGLCFASLVEVSQTIYKDIYKLANKKPDRYFFYKNMLYIKRTIKEIKKSYKYFLSFKQTVYYILFMLSPVFYVYIYNFIHRNDTEV